MNKKQVFCLCLVFLAAGLIAHAENEITIQGMVMDSRNHGLPGVALFLKENTSNRETLTYTGADGEFEFEDLTEGNYEMRFEGKGFQTITAPIQLRQETVRKVEATLRQLEGSHKWERHNSSWTATPLQTRRVSAGEISGRRRCPAHSRSPRRT